jgi:hypothetical protein
MSILVEPHKQMLRRLVEFNVDFILIGGYAVNLHGYVRATGNMDIWLKPSNENREKFLTLLKAEGFDDLSLSHISKTPQRLRLLKPSAKTGDAAVLLTR